MLSIGGGGGVWIFSGIHVAHHHSSFEGNLMNFYPQPKTSDRGPKFVSPKFLPLTPLPPPLKMLQFRSFLSNFTFGEILVHQFNLYSLNFYPPPPIFKFCDLIIHILLGAFFSNTSCFFTHLPVFDSSNTFKAQKISACILREGT